MQIQLSEFMYISSLFQQQLKGVLFYKAISKNHYNSMHVQADYRMPLEENEML